MGQEYDSRKTTGNPQGRDVLTVNAIGAYLVLTKPKSRAVFHLLPFRLAAVPPIVVVVVVVVLFPWVDAWELGKCAVSTDRVLHFLCPSSVVPVPVLVLVSAHVLVPVLVLVSVHVLVPDVSGR